MSWFPYADNVLTVALPHAKSTCSL